MRTASTALDRRRAAASALALLIAIALAAPAAAAETADRKKGGGKAFVQFPTLTATIRRPDGRRGVMTVEAGVDAPDPAVLARVNGLEPRLLAAYTEAVQQNALMIRPGAAPDAERLSAALQQATDRVLGRKGARLLLGTILVN